MATHSSILAWRIPWMEEPGRLQCTGSQRVGHDWATSLSLSRDNSASHSSTLAWKIPWMEGPDGLQSMGSLESDRTERLHFIFSLSCIGEGNGNPLQCSCQENPRDRGAWWAAVYGVTQSRTRLKRLSSMPYSKFLLTILILHMVWYMFQCYSLSSLCPLLSPMCPKSVLNVCITIVALG